MTTDKFGREIRAGDYIVYGTAIGYSNTTRVGRVTRADGKLQNGTPCIRVLGVDDNYGHEPAAASTGVITCTERVIVIPESVLPESYVALLRGRDGDACTT